MGNGANIMPILLLVAIVVGAAGIGWVSVKYLGPNNPVEQVAQEVVKEELPALEGDLPEAAAALEAVANPHAAQ
jgi:hypothetical protein